MSKLSALVGKPKVYRIGDIDLEISPRTLSELDLFLDLANEEKRTKAFSELIKSTLKQSVTDATDDEINKIALRYFKELSEAIIDVNGLKNEFTK